MARLGLMAFAGMMRQSNASVVVAIQAFHVAFLLLHDWIPLGRWNDTRAVRAVYPTRQLLRTTVISAVPFVALLAVSFRDVGMGRFPLDLRLWLWIAYGLLFLGELRAWWIPYIMGGDPLRAERYRKMFGSTYSFLPPRNGIAPNALHVVLHAATLCLLLLLFRL